MKGMKQTPGELRAKAKEALKALGGTPATVASRLRAMHCYGKQGSASECPVAQYMKKKSFRTRHPQVNTSFQDFTFYVGESLMHVRLPRAVTTFANEFDEEKYPSLILRKSK